MRKTFCDITGVVIGPGDPNAGDVPVVIRYGGVELLVIARDRLDGGRPDLRVEAIRRMVERGEIRPAPELLPPAGSRPRPPLLVAHEVH